MSRVGITICALLFILLLAVANFKNDDLEILEDGSLIWVDSSWWGLSEISYELRKNDTQWYYKPIHSDSILTKEKYYPNASWDEFIINGRIP